MELKNLSNLCFPIRDMFTKLISFKLHYPKSILTMLVFILLLRRCSISMRLFVFSSSWGSSCLCLGKFIVISRFVVPAIYGDGN